MTRTIGCRLLPVALGVMVLAGAAAVFAQTVAAGDKTLAFEVAIVRRDNGAVGQDKSAARQDQDKAAAIRQYGPTPDGYRMTNMPLLVPILAAYPPTGGGDGAYFINERVLGGPDWMRTEMYDIQARVAEANLDEWHEPASQKAMLPAMLQTLLADRCKLAVHREVKEISVYALVVGKNGPKFKESKPGDQPHPGGLPLPGGAVVVPTDGGRILNFYGATMTSLAQILSKYPGRPVQDKTGLTGKYDFSLEKEDTADASGAWVFSAVQEQFGLRLEPAKGSVETLVIDHLERPSEN